MDPSRPLLALLLVASSLAGCFGGDAPAAEVDPAAAPEHGGDDAPATPAPASPSGQPARPTPTPSSPASSGSGAPGGETAPGGEPAPAGAPVQVSSPFAWDGSFAPSACLPSGPNACTGQGLGDGETLFEVPRRGAPLALDATLTWEAATPATGTLGIALLATTSCGDGCWEVRPLGDAATGASPLALAVPGIQLEEGEGLLLRVFQEKPLAHPGGAPVYAYVETEQAFALEGALVEMVAPAA